MFSGCTVLPYNKVTKLGSSDQEASPLAGKNTAVFIYIHCKNINTAVITVSS